MCSIFKDDDASLGRGPFFEFRHDIEGPDVDFVVGYIGYRILNELRKFFGTFLKINLKKASQH
jgi:hypothetical protein